MIFSQMDVAEAEGAIAAHTLRLSGSTVKKGSVLSPDDIASLVEAGIKFISAARLEQNDLDENAAAVAVAQSLVGDNLTLGRPMGGRVNLYANENGVTLIDSKRIDAINLEQCNITVGTLPEYADTVVQQAVATVKVIPFAVAGKEVDRCVALARTGKQPPAVSLQPYQSRKVALILTASPGMRSSILDSTRKVTSGRLQALNCQVDFEARCAHTIEDVSEAICKARAGDCDLILICGASVTIDVSDVVPAAIVNQGGEIIHYGMPVEPGNMLLLARIGEQQVVNLPGCSRSPKLNGFDWILQRIVAGIPVTARDIQMMGVGGLIKDIPHLHRRQKKALKYLQPALAPPKVAAVILAAGQSRRMGEQNKLLATVAEAPMVSHVLRAAVDSEVEQVVVVTGHEAELVQQALLADEAEIVFNTDYMSGLASSLRTGIGALAEEMDGVVILLGDMPLISAGQINELIAEFNPAMERDIVVPFRDGQRGNPVIWSRRYFPALKALTGDTGGRSLIEQNIGNIWDVPMTDDAVFTDFDTPDSLRYLQRLKDSKKKLAGTKKPK